MTLAVRAVFCVIAYLGAVLSPLVFAAIGASRPDHGFSSVARGFVGSVWRTAAPVVIACVVFAAAHAG